MQRRNKKPLRGGIKTLPFILNIIILEDIEMASAKKKYVLRHSNKYFCIAVLGVQFSDGVFETTDRALAEKILAYEGVEVISQ